MMHKELQYIQHSQGHLCGQVCLNICRTQAVSILNSSIFKKIQDELTQIQVNRLITQAVQMLKWALPVSIICNSFGLVRAFLPLMMGMVWERAWR